MKAEMSADGVITISPENSTEAYALRRWVGANLIEALVEPVGSVGQWDSSKLMIDANWPREQPK